jgi:hypothetical protein
LTGVFGLDEAIHAFEIVGDRGRSNRQKATPGRRFESFPATKRTIFVYEPTIFYALTRSIVAPFWNMATTAVSPRGYSSC